jgi:hypothetical protein
VGANADRSVLFNDFTALDIAKERNFAEIITLLEQEGHFYIADEQEL